MIGIITHILIALAVLFPRGLTGAEPENNFPENSLYRMVIDKPVTLHSETADSIIVQTASLDISPEIAFRMFTENRLLERWLTVKADVEPVPGGRYELFWEPDDPENNSTLGCRVLATDGRHFISFEWKGPRQYKNLMNGVRPLTNVTVLFSEADKGTEVVLIHTGWRESDEWEEARRYFVNAWRGAFVQLVHLSRENFDDQLPE